MIIGDRLREMREEKKLSQGDIEKRTGLLRCYISRVENGHTVPAGDSDEADRHSELIAITVPGWIRSVVGAKRRWRMNFPQSDRDRQACCCCCC